MMCPLESITCSGVFNLLYGTYIRSTLPLQNVWSVCHKCSPVALNAADVFPLIFSTVQLYLPKMSLTDWAMVSTVSYVPVVVSVTTCVCWYVSLIVITPPSFLQVTVVAGPPAEVQVRDRVVWLYTSAVVVGVPTTQKINIMQWTLLAVVNFPDVAEFTLQVRNNVYLRLAQAYLKYWSFYIEETPAIFYMMVFFMWEPGMNYVSTSPTLATTVSKVPNKLTLSYFQRKVKVLFDNDKNLLDHHPLIDRMG